MRHSSLYLYPEETIPLDKDGYPMLLKRCKKCGQLKSINEFYIYRHGRYYVKDSNCKRCHNDQMLEWYAKNRERALAKMKERYQKLKPLSDKVHD